MSRSTRVLVFCAGILPAVIGVYLVSSLLTSKVEAQSSPGLRPPFCAEAVRDQTTGNCIEVWSHPTEGALLPLGSEFFVTPDGNVGINTTSPEAGLDVRGNLSRILTGTVSILSGTQSVVGFGTLFQSELKVGATLGVEDEVFTVASIEGNDALTVSVAANQTHDMVPAFTNNHLLRIQNAASETTFIIDECGNMGVGTESPQAALEVNGSILGYGVVPIGTILAWHGSLTGTPVLEDNWVECDGSIISDPESPYDGQNAPNLNGATSGGNRGQFLRGHSTSGQFENHQLQTHGHSLSESHLMRPNNSNAQGCCDGSGVGVTVSVGNPTGANHGSETRPSNMSVVWIMRIK